MIDVIPVIHGMHDNHFLARKQILKTLIHSRRVLQLLLIRTFFTGFVQNSLIDKSETSLAATLSHPQWKVSQWFQISFRSKGPDGSAAVARRQASYVGAQEQERRIIICLSSLVQNNNVVSSEPHHPIIEFLYGKPNRVEYALLVEKLSANNFTNHHKDAESSIAWT